jgi:hypothetical protein
VITFVVVVVVVFVPCLFFAVNTVTIAATMMFLGLPINTKGV